MAGEVLPVIRETFQSCLFAKLLQLCGHLAVALRKFLIKLHFGGFVLKWQKREKISYPGFFLCVHQVKNRYEKNSFDLAC